MKVKPKPVRYRRQCAKCRQNSPKAGYPELLLTDTTGHQSARATLCPTCLQRFWLVYSGFIQTRPAEKPVDTPPPRGFRAGISCHRQRHEEAIQELEQQIHWHRQGIQYLEKMPEELSAPHPEP